MRFCELFFAGPTCPLLCIRRQTGMIAQCWTVEGARRTSTGCRFIFSTDETFPDKYKDRPKRNETRNIQGLPCRADPDLSSTPRGWPRRPATTCQAVACDSRINLLQATKLLSECRERSCLQRMPLLFPVLFHIPLRCPATTCQFVHVQRQANYKNSS